MVEQARRPQRPQRTGHNTVAPQANPFQGTTQNPVANQPAAVTSQEVSGASSNPFQAVPSQRQPQRAVGDQGRRAYQNTADQSFDTTTNLRGDKVNLPNGNSSAQAAATNPFSVVKQNSVDSSGHASAGRTSTGSQGGPQYAQVQNPFQGGAAGQTAAQQPGTNVQNQTQAQQNPGKKSTTTSDESLPRPLKSLNTLEARSGQAIKYSTASVEFPPAPTVPQVAIDEGRSGPRFVRSPTMLAPKNQQMQQQSGVSFGLMIQPLAQPSQYDYAEGTGEVPQVDFLEEGPFRCQRCKAYVNPNFTWLNDGRKAQCNFCLVENDVPGSYYCMTNEFGKRRDRDSRPELMYGTYEIKAPSTFSIREPLCPTYVFMLDCSINAFETGFLHQSLQSIKTCLESLPNPEQTKVCFATYDVTIQFFQMSQDPNGEPLILQIGDIMDPYIPLPPSKLLMNMVEDGERIFALLDKIYNFYSQEHYAQGRQVTSIATGAALLAAKALLEEKGGRIMLFANTLGAQGVGRVQNRLNATLYNTDQEGPKMLAPEHDFYRTLALDCISKNITVDLFLAMTLKFKSMDVATMAPVTGITGGDLHLYADFDVVKHGEKLYYDIFRKLTRITGSDCMMKVRVSTGMTVTEYFGQFGSYQQSEFGIASIDQDKVYSVMVRSDQNFEDGHPIFAQCALLYTDHNQERKIRIFNYSWKVAGNLYNYCKSADVESVSQFKIRHDLTQIAKKGAKGTKEKIINELVEMLTSYRSLCANQTNPTQLVLPETLTLLPLYLLSALKKPALKLLSTTFLDQKVAQAQNFLSMGMEQLSYELYPHIYKVTDVGKAISYGHTDETTQLMVKPVMLPCRGNKLSHYEAFIIDNGQYLTLLVGSQASEEFLYDMFGVSTTNELEDSETLPAYAPVEGERADFLTALLEQIRYERVDGATLPTRVILSGNKNSKPILEESLIEDSANQQTEFTYQDFLSMLHKRIRASAGGSK